MRSSDFRRFVFAVLTAALALPFPLCKSIQFRKIFNFFTDILGPIVSVKNFWYTKASKMDLCFV